MTNKENRNNKHAFWQALVFTVIIFAIGLIMGFFFGELQGRKSTVYFN